MTAGHTPNEGADGSRSGQSGSDALGAQPAIEPVKKTLGWPVRWLVTWFGAGLVPRAPGTAGSVAALPVAWILAWIGGAGLLLAAALVVFVVGIVACGIYARRSGREDPPEAVIDEVAGQWLALVPAPLDPLAYALGLLLFRIFDVAKPGPIGAIDRCVGGGLGIMADDMVAGLAAAVGLWALLQTGLGPMLGGV